MIAGERRRGSRRPDLRGGSSSRRWAYPEYYWGRDERQKSGGRAGTREMVLTWNSKLRRGGLPPWPSGGMCLYSSVSETSKYGKRIPYQGEDGGSSVDDEMVSRVLVQKGLGDSPSLAGIEAALQMVQAGRVQPTSLESRRHGSFRNRASITSTEQGGRIELTCTPAWDSLDPT